MDDSKKPAGDRRTSRQLSALRTRLAELKQAEARRKEMEEALRESEERYRRLMDNLPVAVYRSTPEKEGRLLTANPALVQMFGFESAEEFMRRPIADTYVHPEERESFSNRLIREGHVENVELHLKKKDGTGFWGSVWASVERNPEGEIEYFNGIIEDITEHKHIEKALRESEERFRTVVEAGKDAVIAVGDDEKHLGPTGLVEGSRQGFVRGERKRTKPSGSPLRNRARSRQTCPLNPPSPWPSRAGEEETQPLIPRMQSTVPRRHNHRGS